MEAPAMRSFSFRPGSRFSRLAAPAILGASLLGGVLAQAPAVHADDWCWGDPVVQVNGTIAAINVGIQGDAATVAALTKGVTVTVRVPAGSTHQVLQETNPYFAETVNFVVATSNQDIGRVDVQFDISSRKLLKQGEVQVTTNGQTTTVVGRTAKGITTHFTVQ
jgi:hypothetical protein